MSNAYFFNIMKEDRKAKDVRDKIKQKIGKKGTQKDDILSEDAFEKIKDYKVYINEMIGEGSYGRVYKTLSQQTNQLLACKIIMKSKLQNMKMYNEQVASELQNRIKTQSQFHKQLSGCPYIVKLIDTFQNKKAYYFFMEYCDSDLSKIIKQKGVLSEEVALRYFTQMVEGYRSMYQKNAFHRDLKPENLLIKDDSIKISDFGFVKIFSDIDHQCKSGKNKMRTQSKVGSIKYMSPDILNVETNRATYNAQKSDIWSMGIILYKMLYGKEPFHGKDEEQIIKNITEKELKFPDTAKISPEVIKNTKISSQVKKLLKKMIQKDESSRLSFKKLYNTLKELNRTKEQEKQEKLLSGINQQGEGKERGEGEAKNKKEELLIVYNKLLVKIYHDNTNYATLQQIGVQNYFEVGCKLIYLIHQKRTSYLQSQDPQQEEQQQVSEKIKQDISLFHNYFAQHVKKKIQIGQDQTIQKILLDIYPKIKNYPDFEDLMLDIEVFLIDLLLLLSLELRIVKPDYVYTWSMRSENYKQKSILSYKQNTINMIQNKLNGLKQNDEQDKTKKQKQKQKKQRNKNKDKANDDGEADENKKEDSKQKDKQGQKQKKESKKSRQKNEDKQRSKQKKQKK